MLLVVVDQPRIRRRGEDPLVWPDELEFPPVAVQHRGLSLRVPDVRELLDPRQRVERVPAEESGRRVDRSALTPVLVAPVLPALRRLRRLEVEMRGSPRRPRGTREDHAQDVAMPVLRDQIAEGEQLRSGSRRVPLAQVAADARPAPRQGLDLPGDIPQLLAQLREVVRCGLDAHQEAVERGNVRSGRVEP